MEINRVCTVHSFTVTLHCLNISAFLLLLLFLRFIPFHSGQMSPSRPVANDDGSGSLLGTRAKLNSPLEYNRTYSCQLSIAVHDSARDTPASGGQTYEDTASLTLIYRNNTPPKRTSELTSNAAVVAIDTGSTGDQQRGNSLPRPRIEKGSDSDDDRSNNNHHQHRQLQPEMAFDEHGNPHLVSDQGGLGPKAYDLTGKRAQHSECALCQNGGQCIVTETGYRFRCYCQHGFDGALCERPTHRTDIDRMLASITANELLFYGSLIVIVNLLGECLILIKINKFY